MQRTMVVGLFLSAILAGCTERTAPVAAPAAERFVVNPAKAASIQLRYQNRIGEALGRPAEAGVSTDVVSAEETALRQRAHQRPINVSPALSATNRGELANTVKLGGGAK